MILLGALFASLAVLPPSRGQTQLEDARIMPTPEEIKSVFEGVEAAGWSDKEGYNSKFSYNTNANKDRAATSDVKDPNFSECNQVTQGFVECHKCLSCEVEVAAFDSCGFMTSRKCTKVQYDEAKVTENCKKLGEKQENGDPGCSTLVKETVTDDETKRTCVSTHCEPVLAESKPDKSFDVPPKTCEEVFKEKTKEDCAEGTKCLDDWRVVKSGTKCTARCPISECEKIDQPPQECSSIPIEGDESHVCKELKNDESCATTGKCVSKHINIDEREDLADISKDGEAKIRCTDKCKKPVVKEKTDNGRCAKDIECTTAKCPEPSCFVKASDFNLCGTVFGGFKTDDCNCKKLICKTDKNQCLPECEAKDSAVKQKSLWNQLCGCTEDDVCVDPKCEGDACCEPLGLTCCTSEETCCPRDEDGCFKNGKKCMVNYDGEGWRKLEDCDKARCDAPHRDVIPNDMCCFGDDCCKGEGCCQNTVDCCVDGCCRMEVKEGTWELRGGRCPPECKGNPMPTKKGGNDDNGKPKVFVIDEKNNKDSCAEGMCCCHDDGKLKTHICETTPLPPKITTTPGPGPKNPPTPETPVCNSVNSCCKEEVDGDAKLNGDKCPPECKGEPMEKKEGGNDKNGNPEVTIVDERKNEESCPEGMCCCHIKGKLKEHKCDEPPICPNGCCKQKVNGEVQLSGEKCPPECKGNPMEKKEGGVDEKGNPTVYITDVDKQYSKEICPTGKCCCHKEGKLEEHDCEPGPICTTSCCKKLVDGIATLTGEKCPPECKGNPMPTEKKEGGKDENGIPKVTIVDEQKNEESCPEGKCCCHEEGKLQVHECDKPPICEEGCCRKEDNGIATLTGDKCPPECKGNPMEKVEGGKDKNGNPKVYIVDVDQQSSKESCAEGKCCCHVNGRLRTHECDKPIGCSEGCCKKEVDGKIEVVGKKCPPKCKGDPMEKKKEGGNDEKGDPKVYITDEQKNKESCPEGKCCCHEDGELQVHDCEDPEPICPEGCCKKEVDGEIQVVGKKCPPQCEGEPMQKKEGGNDEKGNPKVYITDEQNNKETCPAGKCCCHTKGELEVHDCDPPKPDCPNGCCKKEVDGKIEVVGGKCPPKCEGEPMKKIEGGNDENGKPKVSITDEQNKKESCPKGKCCCHEEGDLKVHDCDPPKPDCPNDCCIVNEVNGEIELRGGKCPPKCKGDPMDRKEGGNDEKGNPKIFVPKKPKEKKPNEPDVTNPDGGDEKNPDGGDKENPDGQGEKNPDEPDVTNPDGQGEKNPDGQGEKSPDGQDEKDSCPEGKCCCHEKGDLKVMDCDTVTEGGLTTPAGQIVTTTPPPGPAGSCVKCKELEIAENSAKCTFGCCSKNGKCCPKDKACCETEEGDLHVIGDHCCSGDGCCAMKGADQDCCKDEESCCSTGCFIHCKMTKKDGSGGYLDQLAKNPSTGKSCDCRPDATEEKCANLNTEYKSTCFKLKEVICAPGKGSPGNGGPGKECKRQVCGDGKCENTFASYLANFF